MTATTTPAPSTPTATPEAAPHPLMASRQAVIDRYLADGREAAEHRAHGRKAMAAKAEGRMANRSREIRECEVEMEIEGVEYTPWEKPASSRTRVSRVQPWTQADTDRLAKLGQVYKATKVETTKAAADLQIQGLLKRAQRLAKTVKDPRKA